MNSLTFTVFGTAQPQGSARAFMPKGSRYPVVTSDNPKVKPWRQEIAHTAIAKMGQTEHAWTPQLAKSAVRVEIAFFFERPQSGRKNVLHKTTRPDGDKLQRAVLDALTGIVYADDAQVTQGSWSKFYGSPARTEIKVELLEPTSGSLALAGKQLPLEEPW